MSLREIKDKSDINKGLQVKTKDIINHSIDEGEILIIEVIKQDNSEIPLLIYEVG
ncbi:MAG: hypothetical protein ACXAC7_04495 [Candidatus Hodarchaeales archaeon]|jgi:hypothetical protein